jgi:hypothetical protein
MTSSPSVKAAEAIARFARALSVTPPELPSEPPSKGEALFWRRSAGGRAQIMKPHAPAEKAERHIRKYAEGALGEDKSFHFRGPSNALNLRAQNLTIFMQTADGVDDETWLHHLQANDYSRWVREAIKDDELAEELRQIEDQPARAPERRDAPFERRSNANTRRLLPRARTLPSRPRKTGVVSILICGLLLNLELVAVRLDALHMGASDSLGLTLA